jgi:hypothetical protein
MDDASVQPLTFIDCYSCCQMLRIVCSRQPEIKSDFFGPSENNDRFRRNDELVRCDQYDEMCGMIACAIISGAKRYLHKWRPRAGADLSNAACRHVRARRLMKVESHFLRKQARCLRPEISARYQRVRTTARLRRSGNVRKDVAPWRAGRRPIRKFH